MRTLADIKRDHQEALEGVERTRTEYESLVAQGSKVDDVLLNIRFKNQGFSAKVAELEKEATESIQIGHVYEIDLKSINIPHAKYFWRVYGKKTKYLDIERVGPVIEGEPVPDKTTIKAINLKVIEDEVGQDLNDLSDLGF
jgi:hypothetical protein